VSLVIPKEILRGIHLNGQQYYPEEGAGLMLGKLEGDRKQVMSLLPIANAREDSARHNRYLLTPHQYLHGELEAARLGLDVVGVFHSHPDHPNQPSEFDREWAMPVFFYLITSIYAGKAVESRSWLLGEDRQSFYEEELEVIE
jgi:proteasome lid subunit RPN8/RPN11